MSSEKNAFSVRKHRDVRNMAHKAIEIYISTQEIFDANVSYKKGMHWNYVKDKFWAKHRVKVLDVEKLVLYTTVDDNTMKIVGHTGYSLTDRQE